MSRKPLGCGGWLALVVIGAIAYNALNTPPGSDKVSGTITAPSIPKASGSQPSTRLRRFVTATKLNVRGGPSTTYGVVRQLRSGDRVDVLRVTNGWANITLASGGSGWVSAQYLGASPPATDKPAPQVAGSTPRSKPIPLIAASPGPSRQQVVTILIRQSIASYPGSCPCPYNSDRAGRRCGGRSAYSRPGGYSPLCYPSDVTNQMVQDYRAKH